MTEPNNPESDTPDSNNEWQDWHKSEAEKIKEDIDSSSDSFDKSMLTLSSGALGVSLAFIKDIVPLGHAVWLGLLVTSWIVFAVCILTTVVSFQFSIVALKKRRGLLDEMLRTQNPELQVLQDSGWNTAVSACNFTALVLFILGLACTMMFIVKNVTGSRTEKDSQSYTPTVTQVTNCRMNDGSGKNVEKAATPKSLEKGRQPAKIVPPPKAPAPPPSPAKQQQ